MVALFPLPSYIIIPSKLKERMPQKF